MSGISQFSDKNLPAWVADCIGPNRDNLHVALFKGDFEEKIVPLLGSLSECDFPGYARVQHPGWEMIELRENGTAFLLTRTVEFKPLNPASEFDVFGFGIIGKNTGGAPVLCHLQRFTEAPLKFSGKLPTRLTILLRLDSETFEV